MDYDDLLSFGIAAARAGKKDEALRNFSFAARARPNDPKPWLWLCAVVDDPAQQRDCLTRALRADPDSLPAKLLLARIENLASEEYGRGDPAPTVTPPLSAHAFDCPQCGSRLRYDPEEAALSCANCGYREELAAAEASDAEQDLSTALETQQAKGWALAGGTLVCQNCGAHTSVAPEQRSLPCPFCGSPKVVGQSTAEGLIEPHAIAPVAFEKEEAYRRFRRWLGSHFFRPDDLTQLARTRGLRPVYLPFFTFDATVEVTYSAEFAQRIHTELEASPQEIEWVQQTYYPRVEVDDLPVSASATVPEKAIRQISPFNLKALAEYRPEFLADWPAEVYQLSLEDANLLARKRLQERGESEARKHSAIRGQYRAFTIINTEIYRTRFKHILLPVWIGAYRYKNELYRVLINGQTGKVAGEAPIDWVKVALVAVGVIALLALAAAVAARLLMVR